MKTGVKFTYPSGNKLQVIKAMREVSDLSLKEAKDASEAGWLEAPPAQVMVVYRNLKPHCHTIHAATGAEADAKAGLDRVGGVLYRVVGRGINRVASLLETLEMKVWG